MAKNMGDRQPPGRRRRLGKEVKGFRDGRIEPYPRRYGGLVQHRPYQDATRGVPPPPVLAPANPLQKQVADSIMHDPVMKGMDCEQKLRTVVHVQAAYQMHLLFEPSIRTGRSPSGAVSFYPLALLKSSAMGESRRPEPPGLAASFSRTFVSVDTPHPIG